ncbi:MAG TPA: extracellular solute-binding protein [Actinomycetota bacterium]|jgi:multiple sugar transport system substrate-binding protein|nr:extracellular solute-binding protein [Gaiellaceae bacterium]HXJ64114.1 extracellular solute-binding protein [Actinomycetota bacterium]
MKRVAPWIVVLALIGAAAVAASVRASSGSQAGAAGGKATNLTIWVGWSAGHELTEFKKVVAEYDQKHPDVNVKVVGGIVDTKIFAALRSGNVPDIVSSFMSSNVGIFCPSGGWIDLGPLLKKDHIDVNQFPATSRYYTQYKGTRCALPLLADATGLYYNTALFKKAGLKGPPKTLSQLAAYAKKLTVKNSDGSLKVVGYDPNMNFYLGGYGNGAAGYQPLIGGRYFDKNGKSSLASDPAWAKFLRWQKSFVDFYGYDNLVRWQAGAGDEFAPSHPFETGKLAMMLDGEWRVAFIKNEHPELKYATAPMPVADNRPDLYGAGAVNGTIIGLPKGGKHVDEAWDLIKYLTLNDHALAKFSNGIRNVPSTVSSARSPELIPDKNFSAFLKIFVNKNSQTTPITPIGLDHLTTFTNFIVKWQAGKAKDLAGGLKEVDKQIDAKIAQANKGGGTSVP